MSDLLGEFVEAECDEYTRSMLLGTVEEATAMRRARYLTLDVFNVAIDGSGGVVTIDDELDVARSIEVTLAAFNSAILGR